MQYRSPGKTGFNVSEISSGAWANRHGDFFHRGETISGVDYEVCLATADELKRLYPEWFSLAQFAPMDPHV